MPAIDFPSAPAVNDEYSFEGRTWRWNGTGWEVKSYPAALLAGTAANPSLYFSGDPNTGLYSPGADQVAISTGGTGRLFVDADGDIGVGVATPTRQIDIATSNTTAGLGYTIRLRANPTAGASAIQWTNSDASYTNGYIACDTSRDIYFASGATERMRISLAGTTTITSNAATAPFIAKISTSEVARIDSSGRVLVGTSSSRASANNVEAGVQIEGVGAAGALSIIRDGGLPYLTLGRSGTASIGSNTLVSNNDELGRISWAAADGTDIQSWAAQISAEVDGTPGTNDMPGRLVFSTTADGAANPTERLRIANDGRHTINSSAHQGTALTTTAPAKLYTSTGTYTDTATAASGTVTHGTIVAFDNPAIAATNVTVTYTNASTVYIDGAPTNGTNVTITNPFALFVAAGASRFGGNVLSSSATGGIGYATGAGSAQTQATSRTQGVTINTICGAITLFSAAGSTTWQSFTVTNSTVAATDNVIVNQKSGTDLYMIHVTNVAAGSFRITYATTGGTTTEQPVFNFSVIKAVTA